MNWRDLMTAPAEADNPLTQITHNTQNLPPVGSSADIVDIALEESAPAALPDVVPTASLEPDNAPAPNWHGFILADLEAAAGVDWPEVRDRPGALAALAELLRTQAQRDRGEVPPHYTQACECATCGPVWLWEGAPAHLTACPWCMTRAKGAPTPQPPVVEADVEQAPGPILEPDALHPLELTK